MNRLKALLMIICLFAFTIGLSSCTLTSLDYYETTVTGSVSTNKNKNTSDTQKNASPENTTKSSSKRALGNKVVFGHYEQDNNPDNGAEPIEWIVLGNYSYRDESVKLLLSKYALDCRKFDESKHNANWATSTLREWLNGDFVNTTFNLDEQKCLIEKTVKADKNPLLYWYLPGTDTVDRVFLLSCDEVERFLTKSQRRCEATPYAVSKGAWVLGVDYEFMKASSCYWWLRTVAGNNGGSSVGVNMSGDYDYYGADVLKKEAIRPVIFLDVDLYYDYIEHTQPADSTESPDSVSQVETRPNTEPIATSAPATEPISTPTSETIPITDVEQTVHTHQYSVFWYTNESSHWHSCSCGITTEVTAHEYSEWTVIVESSCAHYGSKERICVVCGYKQTQTIEMLQHSEIIIPAVPPTCTAKGKTIGKYCSVCGTTLVEQEDISETPHSFVVNIVPVTAKTDGYTEYSCKDCGYSYIDNIVKCNGSIGLSYRNVNGLSLEITGIGTCTDSEIIIPESIDGIKVGIIGESAFENNSNITSVHLPSSLWGIANRAFYGCKNLKEINIPTGIKSAGGIGDQVFDASGIETIHLEGPYESIQWLKYENIGKATVIIYPSSKILKQYYEEGMINARIIVIVSEEKTVIIPKYAFRNCKNIEILIIENSEGNIAQELYVSKWAFDGCEKLQTIDCAKTIHTISVETKGFYNCCQLKSDFLEGLSFYVLGGESFANCSSLSNITLRGNLYHDITNGFSLEPGMGGGCFMNCTGIVSLVVDESLTELSNEAFYGCTGLQSVILPDNLQAMGDRTFRGCTSLKEIVIPTGLINGAFFFDCTSLEMITVPRIMNNIGSFSGCTSLKRIVYLGSKTEWESIYKYNKWNNNTGNYVVHCLDGEIPKESQ